jgi:hypothetical protein
MCGESSSLQRRVIVAGKELEEALEFLQSGKWKVHDS